MSSRIDFGQHSPRRIFAIGLAVVLTTVLGGMVWHFYSTPPQLQASPEAAKTLDAMFTALTSRNPDNLSACMERIEQYNRDGKLATGAAAELRACNDLATSGAWEQAAKRLYWIIYEQR